MTSMGAKRQGLAKSSRAGLGFPKGISGPSLSPGGRLLPTHVGRRTAARLIPEAIVHCRSMGRLCARVG